MYKSLRRIEWKEKVLSFALAMLCAKYIKATVFYSTVTGKDNLKVTCNIYFVYYVMHLGHAKLRIVLFARLPS